AFLIIRLGAHKRYRFLFGQFQHLPNPFQIKWRIRELAVIHTPAFEVEARRFGASAEFVSEITVFDSFLFQRLFQGIAAEMRIVSAVGFAARVDNSSNPMSPKQFEKGIDLCITVSDAEKRHGY